MSETLRRVQGLTIKRNVRVSLHGYEELAADGIFADDILAGVINATVIEDYPTAPKGPSVLVLQRDSDGQPVHVVWGIPAEQNGPAVLVTAYRPAPERWSHDFLTRRR